MGGWIFEWACLTWGCGCDVIGYIMDYQQLIDDTNYSVRTQISLSPSMYEWVKRMAKRRKTSIAAIVRKALKQQIQRESEDEESRRERLRKLAKKAQGMIKPGDGGWGDVKDPAKLIRQWREEEDRVLSERLGWNE